MKAAALISLMLLSACASQSTCGDCKQPHQLKAFCTRDNGVRLAESGQNYDGRCPPELEAQFLRGYQPVHQPQRVREIKAELAAVNSQLAAGRLSDAERSQLFEQRSQLMAELQRLAH